MCNQTRLSIHFIIPYRIGTRPRPVTIATYDAITIDSGIIDVGSRLDFPI